MPIPSRQASESRDEFIPRCIAEMKVLEQAMTNKQIGAICYAQLHTSFETESLSPSLNDEQLKRYGKDDKKGK
jgi:hypothetical protein